MHDEPKQRLRRRLVTSLEDFLCFCYLYYLIVIWKCFHRDVQTLQPFLRFLAVRHKSHCCVTSIFLIIQ